MSSKSKPILSGVVGGAEQGSRCGPTRRYDVEGEGSHKTRVGVHRGVQRPQSQWSGLIGGAPRAGGRVRVKQLPESRHSLSTVPLPWKRFSHTFRRHSLWFASRSETALRAAHTHRQGAAPNLVSLFCPSPRQVTYRRATGVVPDCNQRAPCQLTPAVRRSSVEIRLCAVARSVALSLRVEASERDQVDLRSHTRTFICLRLCSDQQKAAAEPTLGEANRTLNCRPQAPNNLPLPSSVARPKPPIPLPLANNSGHAPIQLARSCEHVSPVSSRPLAISAKAPTTMR